jgi:hypothetical protein
MHILPSRKIFTYFLSRDHSKNMIIFIFMSHYITLCKKMKIENLLHTSFCQTAAQFFSRIYCTFGICMVRSPEIYTLSILRPFLQGGVGKFHQLFAYL